ncbi:hypothetical protein [Actinomadura rubrisoli]|uniref:AAA+ ATPase domain-containing protein n=1 Tax=Actinomadura rubrisoli TaxID=2530368 RepID=A0A4V2YV24_9ACTN|nr:hypothetical protein [Actinomadura rubrisoli]TDD79857.1 hypothetical protein E1298_26925 [Actinomadura rubrisoli]
MPPLDDNPFPLGSADIKDLSGSVVNVTTPPVADATALLRRYLRESSEGEDRPGVVLAVSGEPGAGKTHLAGQLLRQVRELRDSNYEYTYIEAPTGTLFTLYEKLLADVDQTGLRQRVRAYYAGIVADSLENTGFPSDVTQRLRTTKIDPERFVEQFGLAQSTYLTKLRARLTEITGRGELAEALTLLMTRRELGDRIWRWLNGSPPDQLLQDHGVKTSITSESDALSMMGALIRFDAERVQRLVLVLDDLEKTLPTAATPEPETLLALRDLLAQAVKAGVFLVLCGSPEFFDSLARGDGPPIVQSIEMDRLTVEEVTEYITRCMANTRHGPGLRPFSDETVRHIVSIADGNPRRVIILCRKCYELAGDSGAISPETVEEAAQSTQTVGQGQSAVRKRIGAELARQAYPFHTNHPVGGPDGPRVPFWIPVADTGCAIFVTGSLISAEAAERPIADAVAVQDWVPDCRTLVVVNGFLSDDARKALTERVSLPPLIYTPTRFSRDFESAILRLVDQTEVGERRQFEAIRANLKRMATAQSNSQHFLEMLAFQVESMRTASEEQYAALAKDLRRAERLEEAEPLPREVERLFSSVLASLRTLTGVDTALGEAFGISAPGSEVPGSAMALVLRLQSGEVMRALGAAMLAESIIVAFQTAVGDWQRRRGDPDGSSPPRQDRDALDDLCGNYATLMQNVPIHRLSELADSASGVMAGRPADIAAERAGGAPVDLFTELTDLGFRVRRAVIPDADDT